MTLTVNGKVVSGGRSEIPNLTEESLYCDCEVKDNDTNPLAQGSCALTSVFFRATSESLLNNRDDNKLAINTLSIDRNSALYHRIVNDSLPFYFINQYKNAELLAGNYNTENFLANIEVCLDFGSDDICYLTTCFAHAIDPRYAKDGKLLPGAILPVLQYHANCNERLYPGRVLTIDQDYAGDIECHDDQNEVVLIIGTPEDVIHVHGSITTKTLVVLGCTLIVDGDICASDHIYAYGLGLKANSVTGNEDAICLSLLHTAQPYAEGLHSTLAIDPDTNPKLNQPFRLFECLETAGWISTELKERCLQEDNLKRILEAATIKSKLIADLFEQDGGRASSAQDVWSEQAMEVMQWLQHPATSFADMRQLSLVGNCGIELPPNDPALQEEFRFKLMGALMEPASRSKLERAWQMCSKLVDHRPLEDRKALPPSQQIAAVKQLENSVAEEAVAEVEAEVVAEAKAPSAQKPVSTNDFYEVVDDDQ